MTEKEKWVNDLLEEKKKHRNFKKIIKVLPNEIPKDGDVNFVKLSNGKNLGFVVEDETVKIIKGEMLKIGEETVETPFDINNKFSPRLALHFENNKVFVVVKLKNGNIALVTENGEIQKEIELERNQVREVSSMDISYKKVEKTKSPNNTLVAQDIANRINNLVRR